MLSFCRSLNDSNVPKNKSNSLTDSYKEEPWIKTEWANWILCNFASMSCFLAALQQSWWWGSLGTDPSLIWASCRLSEWWFKSFPPKVKQFLDLISYHCWTEGAVCPLRLFHVFGQCSKSFARTTKRLQRPPHPPFPPTKSFSYKFGIFSQMDLIFSSNNFAKFSFPDMQLKFAKQILCLL